MKSISDFGKTAQALSKNPLGIIALFIVLLYGIAGLVLTTTTSSLNAGERQPLIWFLAILLVFAWLVSQHHTKLYAPSDYKSDDTFIQITSLEEYRRRLEREVAELEPASEILKVNDIIEYATEQQVITQTKEIKRLENQARTDIVVAEDLVLRLLESKYNVPATRQVTFALIDSKVYLDGLIPINGKTVGVEIKLCREKTMKNNMIAWFHKIRAKAESLALDDRRPVDSLYIVIVGDSLSPSSINSLRNRASEIFEGSPLPIEYWNYELSDLKQKFGVEDGL
jgi:hypothetical protein